MECGYGNVSFTMQAAPCLYYEDNVFFVTMSESDMRVTGSGSLTLPDDTETIASGAFEGTTAQCVYLPQGVTSIGSRAFADSGVRFILIPDSVTSIADDAFSGCAEDLVIGYRQPEGTVSLWAESAGIWAVYYTGE